MKNILLAKAGRNLPLTPISELNVSIPSNPDLSKTGEAIHIEMSGLRTILKSVYVVEFILTESEEGQGYYLTVLTKTLGGSVMGTYIINLARSTQVRTWRNLESVISFIREVIPSEISATATIPISQLTKKSDL